MRKTHRKGVELLPYTWWGRKATLSLEEGTEGARGLPGSRLPGEEAGSTRPRGWGAPGMLKVNKDATN